MNNRTNLLTLLTALCLALLATSCGSKTDAGTSDADSTATTDSTAMVELTPGPLADIADFMEKQAFILLDKNAVKPIRYDDLPGVEEEAIKAVGLETVNSYMFRATGEELPAEIEDDNFKGKVVIVKIDRIKRDWLVTFGIKFADEKKTDAAYLVYCDSQGQPLICKKAKTKAKKAILHEQYIYQLKDPNMKADRLCSYRMWKYVCKVKVVSKEDFAKYEEEARVRRVNMEADIEKELIARDLQKDSTAKPTAESGETKGALAALDLQGPVSQCTWKQHYRTETYGFTQGGKLSTYGGKPAQKAFTEVEYDAKGRLEHTQLENAEYYTYENTGYAYDANGRVKAIDYNDGEGYTNSAFTRDAKTGFITVSTYEDRHADMGDDEAKPIKGKITYTYTATDDHGNWTKRSCSDSDGEKWEETRTIKYY